LTWASQTADAPHGDPHLNSFSALHDEGAAIIYSRLMRWDLDKLPVSKRQEI
jgi:hypothetical protein